MSSPYESERIEKMLKDFDSVTVIKHDPDIEGATLGQALLLLSAFPYDDEQRLTDIYLTINTVALKLKAVKYHSQNYQRLQNKRTEEINSNQESLRAIRRKVIICEPEMLSEFEAFSFQFKSVLDMLVKILRPVLEPKGGTLESYGDKGNRVIKHLKQKVNNQSLHKGRIEYLIELVESARDPWLTSMINVRDNITHKRPYIHFGFRWNDSENRIAPPTADVDGKVMPIADLLALQSHYLIGYSTQFIAWTIAAAMPEAATIQQMDEREKEVIGRQWGKDLSRAEWRLGSDTLQQIKERNKVQGNTGEEKEQQMIQPMFIKIASGRKVEFINLAHVVRIEIIHPEGGEKGSGTVYLQDRSQYELGVNEIDWIMRMMPALIGGPTEGTQPSPTGYWEGKQ